MCGGEVAGPVLVLLWCPAAVDDEELPGVGVVDCPGDVGGAVDVEPWAQVAALVSSVADHVADVRRTAGGASEQNPGVLVCVECGCVSGDEGAAGVPTARTRRARTIHHRSRSSARAVRRRSSIPSLPSERVVAEGARAVGALLRSRARGFEPQHVRAGRSAFWICLRGAISRAATPRGDDR